MAKAPKKPRKPLTNKAGAVREITMSDLKRARPAKEVLPELVKGMAELKAAKKRGDLVTEKLANGDVRIRGRGRPKLAAPRELLTVRVDADLATLIKKVGKGYSAKVEAALWKAAQEGAFGRSGGARK